MTRLVGSVQFVLLTALFVCAAAIEHPAAAQSAQTASASPSGGIETVTVTARKRAENIQVVPQTVTAIDAAAIVNSHMTSVEDLSSFATNLDIVQRADNTPDVALRGVGTFGVVQGVGFYVNDVQQFEGQTVRPIDIESIEVLKGPQGTLYGGSNIGGAIKYTTKLPTEEPTAEATVEYGQQNALTLEGAVSGPIVDNRLLGRISVFKSTDDGFISDPYLNRTFTGPDEEGGRLTLEYLDGPTTARFYFSGDRTRSENENLYYTPPNDHTYLLTVGIGLVPFYYRELYSPTLQIDHDFGWATLTSISSYFHSWVKSDGDLNKVAVPIVDYEQNFNTNVWSEELRLASSGDSAFKWLIGGFAQGINSRTVQLQVLQSPVGALAPFGLCQGTDPCSVTPDAYGHGQTSYAVFANGTYDLDQWSFEGGLRVSYYDNRMGDTTAALPITNSELGNLTTDPVCAPCTGQVKRVEVLPMASISYHVTSDDMAYLTVARGFEPSDLNDEPIANTSASTLGCLVFGCQTDVVHDFKPEYALSYELGEKSTLFDDRLRLNADVFFVNYYHRLFEVGKFIGTQIDTFEQNVGSSHNYGFEMDAEYVPIDELTLSAGLGLTRAPFGNASVIQNGVTYNLKGKVGPDTPDYQVTLAADWHRPITDDLTLGARVDARLFGKSFWDGSDLFSQSPYQVVDASLRLEVGDHWTIATYVKNLFDARYNTFYVDSSLSGAPFNEASIGAPRQAFVSLTARY